MSDETAGVLAALVLLGVAGFQVAAALGAPVGRFTQGGQHHGALPRTNRIAAAGSVVLLVGMAAVVAGRVGRGPWPSPPDVLWWITVVYLAVGVLLNLASRSVPERAVFAPVSALALGLVLFSA